MRSRSFLLGSVGLFLAALPLACSRGGGEPKEASRPALPPLASAPAPEEGRRALPAEPAVPAEPPAKVASKSEPPSSRPVAEVNGVPIPERRVLEVAAANRARAEAEGRVFGEEEERVLRAASLDLLIEAELMVQAARQKGLTVSPEEVEAEIHAARARFDTDKEYAEYLQDAHLTEQEVREEAERRLLMNAYRRTILGQKPVTEEDARRYYEEHRSRFVEPEKARVANILIQAKPDDPAPKREAARKRAEEARRRALDGEDFARLAQEYSQHPTAARGGDLGFIPKGAPTIFPQFEEVVFSTPVGQVSEVFETPFGFNVLKVLEKKPAEQLPFEKVRAEVLVELGMIRDSEALSAHLASLKKAANIRILDPAYAMPKPGPRAGSPAPKPGAKAGSP